VNILRDALKAGKEQWRENEMTTADARFTPVHRASDAPFATLGSRLNAVSLSLLRVFPYICERCAPTPSAMVLFSTGLACLGSILYRDLTCEITNADLRLQFGQGLLRNLAVRLWHKAIEEARLHQGMISRLHEPRRNSGRALSF